MCCLCVFQEHFFFLCSVEPPISISLFFCLCKKTVHTFWCNMLIFISCLMPVSMQSSCWQGDEWYLITPVEKYDECRNDFLMARANWSIRKFFHSAFHCAYCYRSVVMYQHLQRQYIDFLFTVILCVSCDYILNFRFRLTSILGIEHCLVRYDFHSNQCHSYRKL